MTGLGERSHLMDAKINLATHVTDIVNVIKWEGLKDIVLVGHSYGGVIISGVADQMHDAVGSIVFLDAFIPEQGDSVAARASQPVREAITALVEKGETTMKPVPAAVFRVNENDRAWVERKVHAASGRDPHREDHGRRWARPRRQEGLHPRQGLSQRAVRRGAGEGQGRRLARLRNAVRA